MSLKPVAVALAVVLTLGIAVAQAQVQVDVETKRDRDPATRGMAHRASEIRGMTVRNAANKELGSVKDIVIDVRAGEVKYAALSYGGILGLGDKLFAVPWNAFEHRHDAKNDEHTLVLNIDEETLKNAPGFDQSEWPNFADGKVADQLDKHYLKFRKNGRKAKIDIQAGPVNVQVDAKTRKRDREVPLKDVVHRSSEITGMSVKNLEGKDLGSVNDLVVDMDSGKVRYAALSYGGILGLGDKLFAVPWNAFDCQFDRSAEKYHLVLAVDEVKLRKAPGFDQNHWPSLADPKFGEQIDKYYGDTRANVRVKTNR